MTVPSFVINESIPEKYTCNLCHGPIVLVHRGLFGYRCLFCRSTFIHRSFAHVFEKHQFSPVSSVYELSAHGAFYKYLSKRFKNLTTSDFIDKVPFGTMYEGRLIQNVERLSFFDESFDVVTSTEVFEHVVDDLAGYKEVRRVLKKNGRFVFTVPLDLEAKTVTRARLKADGKVEHLLEPEYHGDYLRKGILAFRNYGIDIVDRLREAGFSDVKVYNVTSQYNIPKAVVSCAK